MRAVTSPPYTWTVQAAPVDTTAPNTPLPSRYWTSPVSSDYYNWFAINGGWLQNRFDGTSANFNPDSAGPTTPHILWKNVVVPGGLIGGVAGYYALEGTFTPTYRADAGITNYVSWNGLIFYTTNDIADNGTETLIDLHCINLNTGQTLYSKDLDNPINPPGLQTPLATPPTPPRPTLILEVTGQEKGAKLITTAAVTGAYSLWVSGDGLREIDPTDGDTIYYNASFSPTLYDSGFFYFSLNGNLTCWGCRPHEVEWSTPLGVAASPNYLYDPTDDNTGLVVCFDDSAAGYIVTTTYNETNGALIANGTLGHYMVGLDTCCADGNIYYSCNDLNEYAVSLTTGQVVWTSSAQAINYPWGEDESYSASSAYGIFYAGFVDGHVYAWNDSTGKLLWTFYSGSSNYTEWGTWPCWGNIVIADGMLYFATGEHTVPNPIPYGYSLYCINATTGAVIWNLPNFTTYTFASVGFGDGISNGILFYQNMYDGCLYAFGQGPSATTISAPGSGVIAGQPMTITGTVTDQSTGQTTLGIPEQGTPAIADKDQSEWMAYLFENAPLPTDATGVPVTLTVTDSNHNQYDIGTTTSNAMGTYGLTYTPTISGNFTVTATFAGSGAYYGSSATTYFCASPATAASTPTPVSGLATASDVTYGMIAVIIVIIIAIAIVGLLLLRKKP